MPDNPLKQVECRDLVDELADRMQLDGDERGKFVERCMTRAGYKATTSWRPPDSHEASSGESESRERKSRGWFPDE